ncbi:uncharacterized protein LOC142227679 isoform X1 [Haematobia irritans]|uniref:uncharacterized protein LOC142227679 isoform X1 n=1 Tax=Haematobia irritans TaxID=7368 RepID=UPI003F4FA4CA
METVRLTNAKRLVEEHQRRMEGSVRQASTSVTGSLVQAMRDVEVDAEDRSDGISSSDSFFFLRVKEAFRLKQKLAGKADMSENDKRRLLKANDTIKKWELTNKEIMEGNMKYKNEYDPILNFRPTTCADLAIAEEGSKKSRVDEPSSSSLHQDRGKIDSTEILCASSPLEASKGMPSLARNPAEKSNGSKIPVEDVSLNPDSEEIGRHKRNRTKDTNSTEVTMVKKPRKDQGKNLYNEGCIKVAIVDDSNRDRKLTEENWRILESKLLFEVSERIRQEEDDAPFFGNIQSKQGHKILHCKTGETLAWLKGAIEGLQLWEGAKLKVIHEEEVKTQPRVRVFITGPILPQDRLLGLLKAQNKSNYPTDDWAILKMDPSTDAGRSVVMAVNSETLERLETNSHRFNVGLSSAIVRPIKGAEERLKTGPERNRYRPGAGTMDK